jgi:hypothetical protein
MPGNYDVMQAHEATLADLREQIAAWRQAHDQIAARLAAAEDLVRHCWVHSGHADCGWKQMNAEMKRLYQEIIKPDCTPADAGEVER